MKNANKFNSKIFSFVIIALMFCMVLGFNFRTNAATRTSAGTGLWSATATWGGTVPVAGDSVIIAGGFTVTVDINSAVCAGVEVGSPTGGGGAGTLAFNSGSQLTVTRNVHLGNSAVRLGSLIMTNGGTLICNAITVTNLNTWTPGTGTIQFNATNTLDPNLTTFSNLIINGGISTLSSAISLTGNLTIASGATLTVSASNFALNVGGDWLNNGGTFTAGTGTVTFNGAAQDTIGGSGTTAFSTLVISNSVGVRLTQNITEAVALNITTGNFDVQTFTANRATSGIGPLTVGAGATLTIGGASNMPGSFTTHTFNATSTINYDGASQTVSSETYAGNLTLSGSGTVTLQSGTTSIGGNFTTSGTVTTTTVAALAITGGLTVGSGTSLTIGAFTLSVTGATSVTGTLAFNSATGTKTFTGDVVVINGGSWTETAAPAFSFAGNLQNNGTITANTGLHTFTGTTKTFSGANAISIPNVSISGTYTNNGVLTISTSLAGLGGLTQGAATTDTLELGGTTTITTLTATGTGNTVNYYGAGQTIKVISYYNLTLSGSGTVSIGALATVAGNFTTAGTVSATLGATLTVSGVFTLGSGTTISCGSNLMNVGGDWYNNGGTFTAGTGTVTFNGSAQDTIGGSSLTPFYNLTINDAGGIILGINATVANLLTVSSGTFDLGSFTVNRVSSGGTLSVAAGATLRIGGSNGIPTQYTTHTFNASSTIEYYGSGQTVTNETFGNLLLSGSGSITMPGTGPTVAGSFTTSGTVSVVLLANMSIGVNFTVGTGTTVDVSTFTANRTLLGGTLAVNAGGTLNIGGASNMPANFNAHTFNATSTINYDGAAQTVSNESFAGNLTLSGSGTKTLQTSTTTIGGNLTMSGTATTTTVAALAVTGSLSVGAGTTLNLAGFTFSVGSSTSVYGSLYFTSTTGTKTFTGDVLVSSAGTGGLWNEGSFNPPINFGGSLQTDGFFNSGSGVHTFTGSGKFLSGANDISIANVTINGTYTNINVLTVGTALAGSGTLTQGTTGTLNIGGTSATFTLNATASGNTVNYTGTGQTLKVTSYYNLTLSGTGGETFGVITTVTGNLSLSGTSVTATTGAALTVSGNLSIASGNTFTIAGFTLGVTGNTSVSGTLAFSSITGTKTFTGNVVVNSGGSWTETSNPAFSFGGNLQNDGTFTSNSGVHTFIGPADTLNGANGFSIANVTITSPGAYTNNTTLTVGTALSGTGSLTQAASASAILNLPGTFGISTMTATGVGNTVNYSGGIETIKPIAYHNLTLSGSGAKTMTGVSTINGNLSLSGTATATAATALNIGGDVSIGSGTTLNVSTFAHQFGGSFSNSGTFTSTAPGTITFYSTTTGETIIGTLTGTNDFTGIIFNGIGGGWTFNSPADVSGNFTITNGAVTAPSGNLNIAGSYSNAGTFTNNGGTVTFTSVATGKTLSGSMTSANAFNNVTFNGIGGAWAISSDADVNGNFTVTNGSVTAPSGNLNITGNYSNSGTLANNGGTITLNATSTGKTLAGSMTAANAFKNLAFNGVGGGWTFSSNADVAGTFTVTNGAVTAPSGTLNIAGNYSNSGTFTHNNGTVSLNGSGGNQSVGGTSSNTFNNLTINNVSGATLAANATVGGTLAFTSGVLATGSNTITVGTITGAGTTAYVNGNLLKNFPTGGPTTKSFEIGDASKYTPVSVTINNVTVAGSLTAKTTGIEHPNITTSGLNSAKDLTRYWTLTNTGMTFNNYNATFNWVSTDVDAGANTANFIVAKYNNPTWAFATSSGQTSTSITATGLTSFSDFTAGEKNTLTITADAGSNGTITPSGAVNVTYGNSQHFSIAPSTGYHVDSLVIDGSPVTVDTQYTFSNVIVNHTIHTHFAINVFTITASAASNGTITPSGAVSVNYNASQHFSIAPSTGYHVDSLVVDGSPITADTQYTFNSVTANHTIYTHFAINVYTITASAGSNGSITPSGTVNANYNTSQHFSIAPSTGYHVDSLVIDGSTITPDTQYTFTAIAANHTIHTHFAINVYTITASAGSNGSITPSGAVSANYNTSQHFSIAPSTGYHVDSLVIDGSPITPDTQYTFTAIAANHTIHTHFAINVYTITASAGSNGTITPSGAVSANYNTSQHFSIAPSTGYHVDSLVIDGSSITPDTQYTFTAIAANHTIHTHFAINVYTITASAGSNGSITPSGTVNANYNTSQHFSIAPSTGYHVDSLVIDGSSITPDT
ncbi:MAG: hypothetical protein ACHQQQ_10035, partial [Bacteroidota bacterium]